MSGLRWVDVGVSGQVWAGVDADGHCHPHGRDRRHGWGLTRVGIGVGDIDTDGRMAVVDAGWSWVPDAGDDQRGREWWPAHSGRCW